MARQKAERNLLERLLVECVRSGRSVPAESGVRFHLSPPPRRRDQICLIFHVDLARLPLVESGPRPDYLVLHASRRERLLTIIEMKGRSEQELTHGVDQIAAFAGLLRAQLAEHVSGKFRAVVQGILLMAKGAHAPQRKISEAARAGLVILPVSYQSSAELYPYVSRRLQLTDPPFAHQRLPAPDELSRLEHWLAHCGQVQRRSDAFMRGRWSPGLPGIYVNYQETTPAARPRGRGDAGYMALAVDRARAEIGVSGARLAQELARELEEGLGLPGDRRLLRIVDIAEAGSAAEATV